MSILLSICLGGFLWIRCVISDINCRCIGVAYSGKRESPRKRLHHSASLAGDQCIMKRGLRPLEEAGYHGLVHCR
ncbi:uncharacterized protein BO87DRAFT_156726 [Aspergillus neoniger CBS 115656]|uniref:Secreted protein n=1 Tax=Aspergillus neoniger (strain CBS 115656) TaxID=1448310 RepID=A0A318YZF7_ASPNB|nr:hypothetical protein BO87DRAFT_156726 [Aspergillus neoniger CBS 115656]PYH30272.1 hypothetical protein BO87DRAFT_156726 [Aspergillus neoniger CBS 115656]